MLILGTIASSVQKAADAFESIATVITSGSQSSLTFSSIPQTYKFLQLRIYARSNRASNDTSVILRFNGVTSASYANHRLYGNGSTANADGTANDTRVFYVQVNAAGASTSSYSPHIIDIADYTSTSKNKTAKSFGGKDNNNTDGYIYSQSGVWLDTAAITSITLTDVVSTFVDGSIIALYGIKGA